MGKIPLSNLPGYYFRNLEFVILAMAIAMNEAGLREKA